MATSGKWNNLTEEDKQKYEQGWTENMVKFWQEKMMQFTPPVYDTGALHDSLTGLLHPGPVTTIQHHFLEYGLYVAAGVGNGYRKGNSGRDDKNGLQFLRGNKWNHGRGHRKERDWFQGKYLYSLHRLNDFEAKYYGKAYQGMISETLKQMFGEGYVMSNGNLMKL